MIKVTNLSKSYGNFNAVNNLNLTIKKGDIFGLLGPNGAGKSTTIEIISALQSFDNGEVLINNKSIKTHPLKCKKMLGVVPQDISLYEEFSAFDNLVFWGKLNGVSKAKLKPKIEELLDLIGLSSRKNDLIKTYSGGMKRRINIAAALLHEPEIVFMDEPTTGVDPQSRNKIFDIIESLHKKGITIVYTTHYMEEVERLCNMIAIMDNGEIIAQGTIDELQKACNLKEIIYVEVISISKEIFKYLQEKSKLNIQKNGHIIAVECNPSIDLEEFLTTLRQLNITIKSIEIQKSNLESIFLNLTGKQLRD